MADITITAANVVKSTGAQVGNGIAGASITAGLTLYLDEATSTLKIADCENAAKDEVKGIALHAAASGQPIAYQYAGVIGIGATVAVGTIYILSAAGGICPSADAAQNDYITVIGVGKTTSTIDMIIKNSGVQKP